MEEKKKKKGGNDYLKEKIAKLEEERDMLKQQRATASAKAVKLQEDLDEEVREHQALEKKYMTLLGVHDRDSVRIGEMNDIISKQHTKISELTDDIERMESNAEENAKYFGSIIDSLLGAMGFIRRAIWLHRHKEVFERNGR